MKVNFHQQFDNYESKMISNMLVKKEQNPISLSNSDPQGNQTKPSSYR